MQRGQKTFKEEGIVPLKKMVGPAAPKSYRKPVDGFTLGQLLLAITFSALFSAFFVLYGAQVLHVAKIRLSYIEKRPAWPLPSISL